MINSTLLQKATIAGKVSFLNSGIGIAPWAATMPYVIERLNLTQSSYTMLLLAFGVGAVTGMPATGKLIRFFGVRPVLSLSFILLFLSMTAAASPCFDFISMLFISYLWGASLGISEVANNVHATYFEEISRKDLLSKFHGYQTLGSIIIAVIYPALLYAGICLFILSASICIIGLMLMLYAHGKLLNTHGQKTDKNKNENRNDLGIMILISAGTACALMFLSEGLIYDWSSVYLHRKCSVPLELDSTGYMIFQISVALARFSGAKLIGIFGKKKLLCSGSIISMIALFLCVHTTNPLIMLILFFFFFIGLANIVPIVISETARKCTKDKAKAIAVVGTIGYSGVLLGPAVLGFIAAYFSLEGIFLMTSVLMLLLFFILKNQLE